MSSNKTPNPAQLFCFVELKSSLLECGSQPPPRFDHHFIQPRPPQALCAFPSDGMQTQVVVTSRSASPEPRRVPDTLPGLSAGSTEPGAPRCDDLGHFLLWSLDEFSCFQLHVCFSCFAFKHEKKFWPVMKRGQKYVDGRSCGPPRGASTYFWSGLKI